MDHLHVMPLRQPAHQTLAGAAGLQPAFDEQALGLLVQLGDVVVPFDKEVAHFFVVQGLHAGQAAAVIAQARGQGFQPLDRIAPAAVQADQAAAHGGHVGGQFADFGQRHRIGGRHIGQRLTQAGNQARLLVVGKHLHIHAKSGIDFQQYRNRERPLVLLQLVQVAG